MRRVSAALIALVVAAGPAQAPAAAQVPVAAPGGMVVALPLGQSGGYAPPTVVIGPGTQMHLANLDLQQHDVVSVDRDESDERLFASDLIGFGQTAAVEGTERLPEGTYGFYCSLHTNMTGTLIVAGPAAPSAQPAFRVPAPHGPVGFGESVAYELSGVEDAEVGVIVRSAGVEVAGPAVIGADGVVRVPDEVQLAAEGIAEHDVTEITLRAVHGAEVVAEVPLRPKRLQAQHAEPVVGDFGASEVDDVFGGGSALDVRGPGGTISLGTVDLTQVSSIALRAAGPGRSVCHPSLEGTYCRLGTAVVTSGSPTGPIVTVVDVRGTDGARPWIRTVSEPVRYHPSAPVEVFVTFTPLLPSADEVFARVNYLELNGSGVAQPHTFDPDPPGTITLFDGASLDGWRMAGTGWFELEDDGSMRTVAGYGLLWYHLRTFADYTLRLEFKVSNPDANSGVFVRFPDPGGSALEPSDTGYEVQIQDYGMAYHGSSDIAQTGAIYSFEAADRVNTRTVGEWNTLEVTAVGHEYTVVLNGRQVTGFTGSRQLEGYIGLQNHDPYGTVWFRDIRVIPAEEEEDT